MLVTASLLARSVRATFRAAVNNSIVWSSPSSNSYFASKPNTPLARLTSIARRGWPSRRLLSPTRPPSIPPSRASAAAASPGVISSIDLAIRAVVRTRGDLGAIQNRLAANINANSVMAEHDQASDATIRDADVAAEVSALSRSQIFNQAGLAMFAQGNLSAASVLNLL